MNRKFILFIFFFISVSLQANRIQLVFRYDDFTLKSNSLNERVVCLFKKYHIPLVLGVIPCDSKEKMILGDNYPFLAVLKQRVSNQLIEIAQHGLNHSNISNGEFGNVTIEEQYRRLNKGNAILDSIFNIKIVTFIPPYNAYDCNTLEVIEKVGLKVISSSLCINQPWTKLSISYFPETIENFGTLLSVLNHNKKRNGVVVVMFHHYTFDNKYTLNQLDSLLIKINKLNYVKCATFSQLYNNNEISDSKRMYSNMEINLLTKFIHMNGVIQKTAFAILIRVLNDSLYLILSAFFYFLSIVLIYRGKQITKIKKIIFGTILLLFVGLSVWFHMFGPLKLLMMVTLISVGIPIVLKFSFKTNMRHNS